MKLRAFAVRDQKAEAFFPPFFQPTRGLGERMFQNLVKDESTQIAKYPKEFALYEVGEYDSESALLTPCTVVLLITGEEAKNAQ